MDYFLRHLKDTEYQKGYLFFKLIKHVFLLTAAFNKQLSKQRQAEIDKKSSKN